MDQDTAAGIRVEREGPVTTVIIDRAGRRNAVDGPMADALRAAFEAFENDADQQVAVLWGAGGTFCAGADLSALDDPGRAHRVSPDGSGPGPMGPTRLQLSKPVIAAVSGHAVAGGLELALWCDLRVAETSAIFGVYCRRWGVPLIDGGTVRLPRVVGQGRALDMILTGRGVGADEALAMGLASRVVADGQALTAAQSLAADIAAFPPHCMRADRASAYAQWDKPLAGALRQEGAQAADLLAREGRAGAARFVAGAGRHGRFDPADSQS
ncbi:crotonase/enoyl-CoA hydratase family protein [Salinisphaera aquimarina]|uniref:Crotonase/enoyl-CoA hydratase family protein n=1 Tax=Salinisphaera aquimarina TaxID=2094031 RepID=A0ABV7EPZ8_9GAMM